MNTGNLIREKRINLFGNLIVGLVLLATGVLFIVFDVKLVENTKAIVGLSFIPLSLALSTFVNLFFLKRDPKGMSAVIVSENDERLQVIRNESNAKTFKILRWALMLVFFGYTFAVPNDVFETVSWWLVCAFLFFSYILPGVILWFTCGKYNGSE